MIGRIFLSGLGLSIVACGFAGNTGDADDDSPPGGSPRCKFTYVDVCARQPGPPIAYQRDATINTSADDACTHVIPQGAGQPELCVLHGPSVSIAANVTVRAIGLRSLVLVSSGAIAINGRLDVSSTRPAIGSLDSVGAGGDSMPCAAFATLPAFDDSGGGGGGGVGASFGGSGGNGAAAAPSNDIISGYAGELAELNVVRAGCRGQPGRGTGATGGTGGAPGGSVYLAAAGDITIASTGSVAANGGGGGGGAALAGGGGGGSGGWITMEGAAIHLFGKVTANGGGGGEGGRRGESASSGAPGDDGRVDDMAARGGDSPNISGKGGDGSSAKVRNGGDAVAPTNGTSAGSGGGGGAGHLRLIGPVDGDGLLSPPAP